MLAISAAASLGGIPPAPADKVIISAWVSGQNRRALRQLVVDQDRGIHGLLVEALNDFLTSLVEGRPPPEPLPRPASRRLCHDTVLQRVVVSRTILNKLHRIAYNHNNSDLIRAAIAGLLRKYTP